MRIDDDISIPDDEIHFRAIRSQGPGGQNVNKVASAIHLRFDLHSASIPQAVRERLLASGDHRITADGVVVIKAQTHRSQEKNRAEALERLRQLILAGTRVPARRVPTRPSAASKRKRLESKKRRGELKKLRSQKPCPD